MERVVEEPFRAGSSVLSEGDVGEPEDNAAPVGAGAVFAEDELRVCETTAGVAEAVDVGTAGDSNLRGGCL